MAKQWIGKCWDCFFPLYSGCKRNTSQNRVSRKDKKLLKKYFSSVVYKMIYEEIDDLCSCNIRKFYKNHKSRFNLFQQYKNELLLLNSEYLDDQCVAKVSINKNGRLCWQWESDDDYGGTSGIMPFCYHQDEAKGTWAYSEVKDLLYYLYKGRIKDVPSQIDSDIALLVFLKKNSIPSEWEE